jgi:hypothetical protein
MKLLEWILAQYEERVLKTATRTLVVQKYLKDWRLKRLDQAEIALPQGTFAP